MPKLKLTVRQSADLIAHDAEVAAAKADPAKALANLKRRTREALRRNLDPLWGDDRPFVQWAEGMTTKEYIRRHQSLQTTLEVRYTHADRVAPHDA